MSLDPTVLEVLAKTGTPKQRAQAEAILPLRRNGHLLLVSLLCVATAVMSRGLTNPQHVRSLAVLPACSCYQAICEAPRAPRHCADPAPA